MYYKYTILIDYIDEENMQCQRKIKVSLKENKDLSALKDIEKIDKVVDNIMPSNTKKTYKVKKINEQKSLGINTFYFDYKGNIRFNAEPQSYINARKRHIKKMIDDAVDNDGTFDIDYKDFEMEE